MDTITAMIATTPPPTPAPMPILVDVDKPPPPLLKEELLDEPPTDILALGFPAI
jgi:hypothetical protein